ncbi:hypothetical protein [Clostridium mediterraneense]|uniref:hypothetical protein n=1 Tax=Clostridium mediterraneense TaxID=1805472 RepID=UPI00082AF556|nr:hypothetical protein [Clostridium mediterraneense]
MNDIRSDLENKTGDYIKAASRAALGFIPVVGGAITELVDLVISDPVSKRRDEWLIKLYEDLKILEDRVDSFNIANLKNNEQFITIVLNATQLAIRTHSAEKLVALKNVCINTALAINTDDDKQAMFLKYIDELLVIDIKLLYHFMNPRKRCEESGVNINSYYMTTPLSIFYDCNKESTIDKSLVNIRLKNLISKNLLIDFTNASCTIDGSLASRVSDIGREFMEYITISDIISKS